MAIDWARTWVKRHELALNIAGVLIVLLTFATKEMLRDHWKESASAMETAERFFSIEDRLNDLDGRLRTLPEDIGSEPKGSRPSQVDSVTNYKDIETLAFKRESDIENEIRPQLTFLRRLNESLRHHDPGEIELKAYDDQLESYYRGLVVLTNSLRPANETAAQSCNRNSICLRDKHNQIDEYEERGAILRSRVQLMRHRLEPLAAEQRASDQANQAIANWITIALFVVGVLIGFLGKLAGSGEEQAEMEAA